jgi:hypothetical protein
VTPADIVSDPSGPDCWANGLMENREWAWENGKLIEREEMVKGIINSSYRAKVDEKMLVEMFQKLLNLV